MKLYEKIDDGNGRITYRRLHGREIDAELVERAVRGGGRMAGRPRCGVRAGHSVGLHRFPARIGGGMSDWHGYPQHPDADPERPWWRRRLRQSGRDEWTVLVRTDGQANTHGLADTDARHPMPPPPPKCGQVWVWPDETQVTITRIDPLPYGEWSVNGSMDPVGSGPWPPPGAVLASGPGAPWAPMGEK